MSADISFPITHLRCNDKGTFAAGCARFGTAACKRISALKGIGGRGRRNSKREGERERDIVVTLQPPCLYCSVLYNSGGERRRWGAGMTGGSGGWGEECAF